MSEEPEGDEASLFARVRAYLEHGQWEVDLAQLPWWRALGIKSSRVLWLTIRGFTQDNCLFRASALTYVTVLSLVPLLAVSFSVAKGFGFLETLRTETIDPFLNDTFGPAEAGEGVVANPGEATGTGSEGTQELRNTLDDLLTFVQETDFSGMSAVGLLLLIYAVLRLLGTIEKSLNTIWGVHKSRTFVRKVSDYLTIVIVTPLLLLAALAIKPGPILEAIDAWFGIEGEGGGGTGGLSALFASVLPAASLVATCLAFAFVYMTIPNTRTKLLSALLGGLLAGVMWQLAQVAFVNGLIKVADYNAIYVGFASFPILMIWIYVSWVTVFLGAELAAAHQGEPAYRQIARSHPEDHSFKEVVALRLVARIAGAFLTGGAPKTVSQLASELALPVRSCLEVVTNLVEHDILVRTETSGESEVLPARALDSITVKNVLDALKGTVGTVDVPSDSWLDKHLDGLLQTLNEEASESPANCSLQELAKRAEQQTETGANSAARAV